MNLGIAPKALIALSLVLAITFFSFIPALKNDFTNWDDDIYVIQNPIIKDLSLSNIIKIFTRAQMGLYIPLVPLTFAVENHFFGLNPTASHAVNLILHLINCLLVFTLIFSLTGSYQVSFLVSLLFGIHPLHVEPVAWVSGRKDILYASFFISASIFYIHYLKKRTPRYYFLCLSCFILSLIAKPVAVSFPAVMFVLDYFIGVKPKEKKGLFIEKVPFLALAFLSFLLARYTGKSIIHHQPSFNPFDNIFIASYGLIFYLYKLLLPVGLSCLYPYPAKTGGFLPAIFLISPLAVLFILIMAFRLARHKKKIVFGLLFFLFTIAPVLQLFPVTAAIAADRYTYVPFIGLFYIIGEGIAYLYKQMIKRQFIKVLFSIILISLVAILSFLTWNRCKVWRDGLGLWTDALRKYPSSAIIYNNRGVAYSDRGEHDKAISDYCQALRLDPDYVESHNNLGVSFLNKKEYDKALAEFNSALSIDPGFSEPYYNIATIHGINGNHKEVIKFCQKAVELNPNYAQAYTSLCSAYGNLGDFQKAIVFGEKAIALEPHSALAHMNLSVAYFYAKKYDLAIKHRHKAIALGLVDGK